MTYQGWTNHATWLVSLHLDNTQDVQWHAREAACMAFNDATASQYLTIEQEREICVADALQECVQDLLENTAETASPADLLARDLFTGYLEDVNWREIARHYIDDMVEA